MLPEEIIEKIARLTPHCWFLLVQSCKFLAIKSSDKKYIDELMDEFTIRDIYYNRTIYRLPSGVFHRGYDSPAIIRGHGGHKTLEWWYNGKRHRDYGYPAIIYENGDLEWWYMGERQIMK